MHKTKRRMRFFQMFVSLAMGLLLFMSLEGQVYANAGKVQANAGKVQAYAGKIHGYADKSNADDDRINETAGYEISLDDGADLLTQEEEAILAERMMAVTAYGNAVFVTVDENDMGADDYARRYYKNNFGRESGTLFLIDMDNRMIYIYSDGAVYEVITQSYADTITDNVYRYASDEAYFDCAYEAFSQIHTLLQGNKIAQPMKYISNGFLSVLLALLINYFVMMLMSKTRKAGKAELLNATKHQYILENANAVYSHTTKRYSPRSSSSGGGGGRSGGGGGGRSGGGGGGGGHRF